MKETTFFNYQQVIFEKKEKIISVYIYIYKFLILGFSPNNNIPAPLILDFHYQYGSAHIQMGPPWKEFALRNDIMMLWPDGLNDAPKGYRTWNCSSTNGPKVV